MSPSTSPERLRRALSAAAAALAVALPRLALACPVCMAADARRSNAYIATTVMLSLLPLAAIGGMAWLIWRRSATPSAALPAEEAQGEAPLGLTPQEDAASSR